MTYRMGDVSEVGFEDRARRPGDEMDGYVIAKIQLRPFGGTDFFVFWEAVGDEFHSRRFVSPKDAQWVNFDRAEAPA